MHALALGFALMSGSLVVSSASAADPVWFESTINKLASDDFVEREDAYRQIRARPDLSITEIEARLAIGGLTPEQRMRLDRAAFERFGEKPRAGLGVQFGAPAEGGVPLRLVIEGFPAAQFLKAGDVVIAIDGYPVDTQDDMGAIILSHEPGESLQLEIDRPRAPGEVAGNLPDPAADPAGAPAPAPAPGGVPVPGADFERLTLEVPLGRFADLQGGAAMMPDRLERAYRHYQARNEILAASQRTQTRVGDGLEPLQWLRAEGYDHTVSTAPLSGFERVPAWRTISFAGQPQSWAGTIGLRRGDPNAARIRANRGLSSRGGYDPTEQRLAGYRTLLYRIVEINAQLQSVEDGVLTRLDPERLDVIRAERDMLVGELTQLAAELTSLQDPN